MTASPTSKIRVKRCDRVPAHGPLAEPWFDREVNLWKVRLNEEGKAAVADYIRRYPHPLAILKRVWFRNYHVLRNRLCTDDEIDAACMKGVLMAHVRWKPGKANMNTVVALNIRAEAMALLGRKNDPNYFEELNEYLVADETDRRTANNDCDNSELVVELMESSNLSDRGRLILDLIYGINSRTPRTLQSVGDELKITKERVRQLQNRALRDIRDSRTEEDGCRVPAPKQSSRVLSLPDAQ